jgi:hypothetical protein
MEYKKILNEYIETRSYRSIRILSAALCVLEDRLKQDRETILKEYGAELPRLIEEFNPERIFVEKTSATTAAKAALEKAFSTATEEKRQM